MTHLEALRRRFLHVFSEARAGVYSIPIPGLSRLLPDSVPLVELKGVTAASLEVHLVQHGNRRSQADALVERMYNWRGYSCGASSTDPGCITLVATSDGVAVATISVTLDSPGRLAAESLYPGEIRQLRESGARICELTRFAVDRQENSLELLAAMFHVAFLYARQRFGATHILAEVNPRHVAFYARMLGFGVLGNERHCERVDAPAVLLANTLDEIEQEIESHRSGSSDSSCNYKGRSLYPLSLSHAEEQEVSKNLARHRHPYLM